ncbi:MAG: MOSC domain-containing protein [Elainellaceae cyanobacterium]
MGRKLVGSLESLFRYPVKSMQGETLETAELVAQGLLGDRTYALWDTQTSRVASAKNPKKWASLLNCHAAFVQPPQDGEPMPPVSISLPNGITISTEQADLDTCLSDWVGREVEVLTSAPETPSLDQYWPDVEGTANRDTVTQLFMPAGTFFDSCPVHALTTATLKRLQELYPEGAFDPCRFRPNLLIESASPDADFVENAWVGHQLMIGDTVTLKVDTACPRCVVTTLPQKGLPEDLNILRTTAQHNDVIAGIRMSVIQGGTIHKGDSIWLEAIAN